MKLSPSLENLKLTVSLIGEMKNWLLDLIFPRYCPGCKRELSTALSPKYRVLQIDSPNPVVCGDCLGKIILNSGGACHICGLRSQLGTCRRCHKKTPLKGLFAAGQYKDPILKEMIHLFKYQSVEPLKKPLAELIITYLTKELLTNKLTNSVLVPIPLTLKRKMDRGFNQSELLAKEIGQFLNCPVINLLKRKKFSEPQAEIVDWQKRKENISGAFAVNSHNLSPKLSILRTDSLKVILVDDVSTSGATLEEAARVLKEAGVKEIYGLVVARG